MVLYIVRIQRFFPGVLKIVSFLFLVSLWASPAYAQFNSRTPKDLASTKAKFFSISRHVVRKKASSEIANPKDIFHTKKAKNLEITGKKAKSEKDQNSATQENSRNQKDDQEWASSAHKSQAASGAIDEDENPQSQASTPSTHARAMLKPKQKPVFVSNDPTSHLQPPDERAPVRINPEAPGPFIGMATANQAGDKQLASMYADQYVKYLIDVMFEVRDLTQLVGAALVRQGVIKAENWVGVGQFLNKMFASSRAESGTPLKVTQEQAMKRIKPDGKHKAEIYFFFTLDCRWCREMGPEIEKLWQVAKGDSRIKLVGVTLEKYPVEWLTSFREYTGLTIPIFEGKKLADKLGIGFVPAIVILSPTNNVSYLKTGHQTFARLYEFVRTVQGVPTKMTPAVKKVEKASYGTISFYRESEKGSLLATSAGTNLLAKNISKPVLKRKRKKDSLDKF